MLGRDLSVNSRIGVGWGAFNKTVLFTRQVLFSSEDAKRTLASLVNNFMSGDPGPLNSAFSRQIITA